MEIRSVVAGLLMESALFVVGCNQNPTPEKMLDNEIRSFARMLSGPEQVHCTWQYETNLLARIADEPDKRVAMRHFKEMETAILGIKFMEGPFADSYNEWDRSIGLFSSLSFWYSVFFWKKMNISQHLWEFNLKRLSIYRKEIDRIADAKEKPLPAGYVGIHGTLASTRAGLQSDRYLVLKEFSRNNFITNYISLPKESRAGWIRRIEEASGVEFKFEAPSNSMADKLRAIGAPVR